MKKITLLTVMILIGLFGYSQGKLVRTTGVNTVEDARLLVSKNFVPPMFEDTTAANLQIGLDSCGAIINTRTPRRTWYRDCTSGKKWKYYAFIADIPAVTNIYNTDGTLLGNRAVNGGGYNLLFSNNNTIVIEGVNVGVGGSSTNLAVIKSDSVIIDIASKGSGKILTSDAVGGASWQTPTASANTLATYLVQTATNAPANAQIMASLPTGLVKNTTTTGVQSIAIAGTDYQSVIISDVSTLPEIKIYSPAKGVAASSSATNYNYVSIDSVKYKLSTTRHGNSGSTEYGGWLASSTSGDSVRVTAPFGVLIGDSQIEGHPLKHSRLHPAGVTGFTWNYPDSAGQISYHLRALTNMRWYNQGAGSSTLITIRARFLRDAIGLTSDAGDTRGSNTLTGKPAIIILNGGLQDIVNGRTSAAMKADYEWMASTAQANGIKLVVMNISGDVSATQAQLRQIDEINLWLKAGALDQYGAAVVDFSSFWRDPAYNDNLHRHPVYTLSDAHLSAVGTDSAASFIFRSAKLPVLRKAVFINELSPDGFTGYSRPSGITINGTAYTLTRSTDTISINSYVPDSVWIKITSSTNVTGTTYSGFSHIEWFLDNNPNDSAVFTKKTLYTGTTKTNQEITSVIIKAPDYTSTSPLLNIKNVDGTDGVIINQGAGTSGLAQIIVNSSSPLASVAGPNSTLSVTGSITATAGIKGAASMFGSLQVGQSGTAGGSGHGIGVVSNSLQFDGAPSNSYHSVFRHWNSQTPTIGSGSYGVVNIALGWGNINTTNESQFALRITSPINSAGSGSGNTVGGISYEPTVTSLTGITNHVGFRNSLGNNFFNYSDGSTGIGVSMGSINASAKLQIDATDKGLLIPRVTTTQRNAISSPAVGLMVYNTTDSAFNYYRTSGWTSIGDGGVTTLATIGSSANANGATISGSTLNLEPASASFGGVLTTGTQTIAGAKSFLNTLTLGTTGTIGKVIVNRSSDGSAIGDVSGGSSGLLLNGANVVDLQLGGFSGTRFSANGLYVAATFQGAASATSILQSAGSFATGYVAKTATYTATISDHTINCTANTFTVTLPTAASITGRQYTIVNSGSGTITIGTTSSQTFANINATPTTLTLAPVGAGAIVSYTVVSNGANWIVTAKVKDE